MHPFADVLADPGLVPGPVPVAGEQGLGVHHQQSAALVGVNPRTEPSAHLNRRGNEGVEGCRSCWRHGIWNREDRSRLGAGHNARDHEQNEEFHVENAFRLMLFGGAKQMDIKNGIRRRRFARSIRGTGRH